MITTVKYACISNITRQYVTSVIREFITQALRRWPGISITLIWVDGARAHVPQSAVPPGEVHLERVAMGFRPLENPPSDRA